jgi:ribosomal protein S18 acetylase RimI-like enzyme
LTASSGAAYVVRRLTSEEIAGPRLDEALRVFADAIGFPRQHTRVTGLGETLRRHVTRAGFAAFGAFERGPGGALAPGRAPAPDSTAPLIGFSYGYTSQPGLWWREQIVPALTPEQRDYWLADAFELAELHVHPSAQGQRLGSALHDRLMEAARAERHRTALLSVMHRSERARRLYTRRGWQTLIPELRFSTDPGTPFSILGLEL